MTFCAYHIKSLSRVLITNSPCLFGSRNSLLNITKFGFRDQSQYASYWEGSLCILWILNHYPKYCGFSLQFSSVQSLSRVQLFATQWIAAHQPSLSITNSRSPPKPMSIESMMPSSHLILGRPLLFLPSVFPSIRVFSNESALHIRWNTMVNYIHLFGNWIRVCYILTMPKLLTVWISINCRKFWKRWEYQTTWPASWETYIQVRKQQLELDMEQQTGSK